MTSRPSIEASVVRFSLVQALVVATAFELALMSAVCGLLSVLGEAPALACLPGTHAKWARIAGHRIDHGLMDDTARRIARARVSAEGQEGVRAFLDKRKPSWTV